MEYETIELEISFGDGRDYPIAVRSLAGEAHATMRFPFDKLSLENRLLALQNILLRSGGQRRTVLTTEQKEVQEFGQDLFSALITSEILLCYEKSLDRATQAGKGLRIQLRIQPPELAALPWEFMYDGGRANYLALSPRTPIVRYLKLPRSVDPLLIEPPLRMLGMIANPHGVQQLDSQREKERLERAVAPLQQRGLLELTWVNGESWRDLQRTLLNEHWHIFHFIGHGGFNQQTDEGFIVLANAEGQTHLLPATQLAELLTGYYPPRLVLLNACDGAQGSKRDIFSSVASILVQQSIPAVIAMQYAITDVAAIEFSYTFYEAIATGLSVETAIAEARKTVRISIPNSFDWGIPVLYTHAPDGILFKIKNQTIEQLTNQPTVTTKAAKPENPHALATSSVEFQPARIIGGDSAKQSPIEQTKAKRVQGSTKQSQRLQTPFTKPPSKTLAVPTLMEDINFYYQTMQLYAGWIISFGIGFGLYGNKGYDVVVLATILFMGWVVTGISQLFISRRYVYDIYQPKLWLFFSFVVFTVGGVWFIVKSPAITNHTGMFVMGSVVGSLCIHWSVLGKLALHNPRMTQTSLFSRLFLLLFSCIGLMIGIVFFILIDYIVGSLANWLGYPVLGAIGRAIGGALCGSSYAGSIGLALYWILDTNDQRTDRS